MRERGSWVRWRGGARWLWFRWWSNSPRAGSGRTTSSRGSSRSGSSSSRPTSRTIANLVIAQMLFLKAEDPDKDIQLYINSPGGSVTAGIAIYDTMQYVKPPISTICMGQAASMGAPLLCAGTKGKRVALPHAPILLHQPLGGVQGQ